MDKTHPLHIHYSRLLAKAAYSCKTQRELNIIADLFLKCACWAETDKTTLLFLEKDAKENGYPDSLRAILLLQEANSRFGCIDRYNSIYKSTKP